MAAVARGIDEKQRCAVKWLFWENVICFLKVQLYLCMHLFLYLSIYNFYLTIFQR